MGHWLFKSDPETFGIEELAASPQQTTCWDGVRNYQARNFLRDEVRQGDLVLFYHSNANPQAIMGLCRVVREAYPDHTAWEPGHKGFDEKASPENPIWVMVDIQLVERFDPPITRDQLKAEPRLEGLELLRRGSRLSLHPVNADQFEVILSLRPSA